MARQKKTTVCPLVGDGVGGKWKFWILYHLLAGTRRFGALQRLLPGVSRQMLTIQLRELEQMGLLTRLVYPQALPKVEYSLTELGWSLEPLLHQMEKWGKWYGEQIGPQYDWIVSLGGRWKFWIWYHLLSGPKRFSEVQRLLPQASRQMLAIQLRELEQMGVLHRQTEAPGSPKGAYQLSELGQRSEPMLRQMYLWGRWCGEQIGLEYDWGPDLGEWCDFQENTVWIDSSGVQEDMHSGLDLLIMSAKPHQMTLSLRNEELSLRDMLLYIDSM